MVKDTFSYNRAFNSPVFTFSSGAIATSGSQVIDFHETTPATEKYGSFNNVRISNLNVDADIEIRLNQSSTQTLIIPAGVSSTIGEDVLGGLRSVKIVNLSSTNALSAGDVRITIWKEKRSTESIVARLHQKLFKVNKKFNFSAPTLRRINNTVI